MKQKIDYSKSKETILVLVLALCVLMYFRPERGILIGTIVFGLLGVLSDKFARAVHFLWMSLAQLLSRVSTNALMFVLYFGLLTPIALLRRVFTSRSSDQKTKTTNFIEVHKTYTADDVKNMW